jgi:hypothetical protein
MTGSPVWYFLPIILVGMAVLIDFKVNDVGTSTCTCTDPVR